MSFRTLSDYELVCLSSQINEAETALADLNPYDPDEAHKIDILVENVEALAAQYSLNIYVEMQPKLFLLK